MLQLDPAFTIGSRFNGPPNSGNGGYVSGRLAKFVEGTAQVTLRMPPPLDLGMKVMTGEASSVQLLHQGNLVAEAKNATLDLAVPAPPSLQEATIASKSYAGFDSHLYPSCFVCGPDRPNHDGMGIFAGPLPGRETSTVAAPWRPQAEFGNDDGLVSTEYIWGALDCPGAYSLPIGHENASVILLGRLTAELIKPVYAGESYRVMGWFIERDGRKLYTGTAIFNEAGEVCGKAKGIWIELKPKG
ncbi:MAG: hypothetical protein AAF587_04605 [Bacteroidota bacterium]